MTASYTLWGFAHIDDRKRAEEREGEADQFAKAVSRMDFHTIPQFEQDDFPLQDAELVAKTLARAQSFSFICVDNAGGTTAFVI